MWLKFLALLFLQFCVESSQWLIKSNIGNTLVSAPPALINKTFSGEISATTFLHYNITVPVLDGQGLWLDSSTNCTVVEMCMAYLFRASNDTSDWTAKTCVSHYRQLPLRLNTYTIRPGLYHLSFSAPETKLCTLTIIATAQPCPPGYYGMNCRDQPAKISDEKIPLLVGKTVTFEIPKPKWEGSKVLSYLNLTIEGQNITQGQLHFTYLVREGDFPYNGKHYLSNSTSSFPIIVVIPVPRSGVVAQFVSIINDGYANATILRTIYKLKDCSPGKVGSNCQSVLKSELDQYKPLSLSPTEFQNQRMYYATLPNSLPGNGRLEEFQHFWIGLDPLIDQIPITLYLRLGNVPTLELYDTKVSYNSATNWTYRSSHPNFYLSGPTVPAKSSSMVSAWYVGIHTEYEKPAIRLWVQEECANKCSEHGTCNEHTCSCTSNWGDWYCQTSNLPPTDPPPSDGFNMYVIGGACAIGLCFILGVVVVYRKMGGGNESRQTSSTSSDYLNPTLIDDVSLRSRQNYNAVTIGVL